MSAMYMKINNIEGDVTAKGHQNWIQLKSLGFHTRRILTTDPGRIYDREGTRPAISEITITKRIDKSSPLLFSESCVGKAKPEVNIDLCKTASSLSPYTQLTLNNVIVSGYKLHATDLTQETNDITLKNTHAIPMEEITLSFDKIELRYTPFNSQNEAQSPIPAGYDLQQAIAT